MNSFALSGLTCMNTIKFSQDSQVIIGKTVKMCEVVETMLAPTHVAIMRGINDEPRECEAWAKALIQ